MLKRDEAILPDSCWNKALDDERTFVLLARDECAPDAIRHWVHLRILAGKNNAGDAQMTEALQCADLMEVEREKRRRLKEDNERMDKIEERLQSRTRHAFTLLEMLVVIAIILAVAALGAALIPRVNDSNNLTRAVDSLEQWLLTAKMRAKRDGLATGIRFVPAQGDAPGTVSTFQYVQQPDPFSGGQIVSVNNGTVTFAGVDFTLGGTALSQPLVAPGDYLIANDNAPIPILSATATTVQMAPAYIPDPNNPTVTIAVPRPLPIAPPTSNYRFIRQPRILLGEEPLVLPRNYAACFRQIPGSNSTLSGTNVIQSSNGFWEILFSPGGSVVGASAAAPSGHVYISVWDLTMDTPDINRVGVVGVRVSTGFIGAYSASAGPDPFFFAKSARESGM